jgi:hypothetical protein
LEVINSGQHSLLDSYGSAFLIANEKGPENIFVTKYQTQIGEGQNVNVHALPLELNNFLFNSPVYSTIVTSEALISAYEPEDQRAELNAVTSYTTAAMEEIVFDAAFFKYSDNSLIERGGTEPVNDHGLDFPVLRYADVLLMYAEAENEINGGSSAALERLNQVRRRAFGFNTEAVSPVDFVTTDQANLRNLILNERFLELAFEGHRWFDLKRTGNLVSTLGIPEFRTVFPIPFRDLEVNENLEQNDGY